MVLNDDDYISRLPDGVVLLILSKLNALEAVRTTILSTRWLNLWTSNTTCLNIDAFDFMFDGTIKGPITPRNFEHKADRILTKHQAPTLHQLNITYPLWNLAWDRHKVDAWINLASKKRVKSLQLHFKFNKWDPPMLLPLGSTPFPSLVTLSLTFPCLTSQVVECLLSNSPNLEELSITGARGSLDRLAISGASSKLARLQLIDTGIEFLQLSAPKLVAFGFSDHIGRICFKDVSRLADLSYTGRLAFDPRCDCYRVLPQLEALWLAVSSVAGGFPLLKNLKQMHLSVPTDAEAGLFFSLFKAAPSLSRLSLELHRSIDSELKQELSGECPDHEFLKEVKVSGFDGNEGQVQVLICIARSSPSLERMIIRPAPFILRLDVPVDPGYTARVIEELPSRLPRKDVKILLDQSQVPINRYVWEMSHNFWRL